jgi:hypothetical protein
MKAHRDAGTDPLDPEVRALAARWRELTERTWHHEPRKRFLAVVRERRWGSELIELGPDSPRAERRKAPGATDI